MWIAINETFKEFPIQLCCKSKDFVTISSVFTENDINYDIISYFPADNNKLCIYIENDDMIVCDDVSYINTIIVLSLDKENYSKFLKLFKA